MPKGDEASLGRMRQLELENDTKIFGKVSLIICRVKVPFFHEVTESLLLIRMASQNVLRTAEFFSGQDPDVSGGTSRGGGGGGGTPLFGLYGYVPLIRVWFSGSWVLKWVSNLTIKRLEKGVFLDWKPFKDCEDLQWAFNIWDTNSIK